MVQKIENFREFVPEVQPSSSTPLRRKTETGGDFERILQEEELSFSLHAQRRIKERDIPLSPDTVERLQEAVQKVREKGGRNSLVLVGEVAFVVNVPERVVVTCMDSNSRKDNIFTNIDSAIIA
ncbi:TIGR02530 family flagellar biosynthesis protein [Candidatus Sordicultor fermentans]|jgi:flagellar operon protein|uniref:TIGR02530 family flagellar biosynthesis protein n=1 Tax=Candidatus Sordicultor fermentans TaxID=1953203 RepID=UPI0016A906CE|nr:TIGR02530 family flagellar biosynthesis protein [Atribacterota bacterium]NLY04558.1 hypothetical protein [Candidatus Atribacteria bacterium]HOQ50977.1 TIGR02530 family flagellar biosynthesis protein [Candidatus Atribacteria bacterium]HQE24396.1 TIGR02530 family flagellar biosynthesis protein [Candidatus Atribacteria bacterium]